MDVGELLRRARTSAGLTQAQLAVRAGTAQSAISAYEAGRKVPAADTLLRLVAATGSRLEPVPAEPVRAASRAELARRGEILEQVLELAEALPVRHAPTLRYPALARRLPRAA